MGPVAPPTTVTSPPRDFGPDGAPNVYFWDPDVLAVDPSFNGLAQPNAPIQRLWTGALWAEGPAWNSVGKFLVFSDIPNNRQMRWIEDDGQVTVFRAPSNNSNGNMFDFQGRQMSCEHLMRRVVRYELDGSITVLADSFEGKRLNSPNDAVPHPDGSVWFTDPPYGGQLYEGAPDMRRGAEQRGRPAQPQARPAARHRGMEARAADPVLPLGPDGTLDRGRDRGAGARSQRSVLLARLQDDCTSPARARGRATRARAARATIFVFDVNNNGTLDQPSAVHGLHGRRREVRPGRGALRRQRQVWAASNAGRSVGYSGVTVWNPDGQADRPHPASPRSAATSPSAAPSATGCSWRAASRSTPSIPPPRARRRVDALSRA